MELFMYHYNQKNLYWNVYNEFPKLDLILIKYLTYFIIFSYFPFMCYQYIKSFSHNRTFLLLNASQIY